MSTSKKEKSSRIRIGNGEHAASQDRRPCARMSVPILDPFPPKLNKYKDDYSLPILAIPHLLYAFSLRSTQRKCISEVARTGIIIIFLLGNLWKARNISSHSMKNLVRLHRGNWTLINSGVKVSSVVMKVSVDWILPVGQRLHLCSRRIASVAQTRDISISVLCYWLLLVWYRSVQSLRFSDLSSIPERPVGVPKVTVRLRFGCQLLPCSGSIKDMYFSWESWFVRLTRKHLLPLIKPKTATPGQQPYVRLSPPAHPKGPGKGLATKELISTQWSVRNWWVSVVL